MTLADLMARLSGCALGCVWPDGMADARRLKAALNRASFGSQMWHSKTAKREDCVVCLIRVPVKPRLVVDSSTVRYVMRCDRDLHWIASDEVVQEHEGVSMGWMEDGWMEDGRKAGCDRRQPRCSAPSNDAKTAAASNAAPA
ncbi:hypothetical protein BC831DRAFT_482073 [Entophlyctis helioformis]|nr:hypothetical protein BC831DRAFT_482073 [Entophlyctis helioformis]